MEKPSVEKVEQVENPPESNRVKPFEVEELFESSPVKSENTNAEAERIDQLRQELQLAGATPEDEEEWVNKEEDMMAITEADRECIGEQIGEWQVVAVFRCLNLGQGGYDMGESTLYKIVQNGEQFRFVSGNNEPQKLESVDTGTTFFKAAQAALFGFKVWRQGGKWHVYLPSWRSLEDSNPRQGSYTRPPEANNYYHYFKTLKEQFGVRTIDLRHLTDLPMVNVTKGRALDNHRIAGAQAARVSIEVVPVDLESY